MRALAQANPTPIITQRECNGGSNNVSSYELTTTGQTTRTFLHLLQLADSGQATMAPPAHIVYGDGRAEGV